jgi:predicted Rdx family selenoprotein
MCNIVYKQDIGRFANKKQVNVILIQVDGIYIKKKENQGAFPEGKTTTNIISSWQN